MPECIKISEPNYQISIWKIEENIDELLKSLYLSSSEINLFNSFKFEKRKLQWLAYRHSLKSLLKNNYNSIVYDENGKPFIENSKINISVSHSADFSCAIISDNKNVGIDIETKKHSAEKIKEKFLNKNEIFYINSQNDNTLYLKYWCAKESIYKSLEKNYTIFLKNIEIENFSNKELTTFAKIKFNNKTNEFFINFVENEHFICSYCINI